MCTRTARKLKNRITATLDKDKFLNVGQNELTVSLRPSSYRAKDHQKTDHHCPLVYDVFNVHTDHLRLSPYPKKKPMFT